MQVSLTALVQKSVHFLATVIMTLVKNFLAGIFCTPLTEHRKVIVIYL